jgi:hypothetical protein
MFNMTGMFTKEYLEKMKFGYLTNKSMITELELTNFGLLEDLFVVCNPVTQYTISHKLTPTRFPIVVNCKNATNMYADDLGFFLVNLKKCNWRIGSPVYGIFGNEIKLVGMVNSLGETFDDLTTIAPIGSIVRLLEDDSCEGKE